MNATWPVVSSPANFKHILTYANLEAILNCQTAHAQVRYIAAERLVYSLAGPKRGVIILSPKVAAYFSDSRALKENEMLPYTFERKEHRWSCGKPTRTDFYSDYLTSAIKLNIDAVRSNLSRYKGAVAFIVDLTMPYYLPKVAERRENGSRKLRDLRTAVEMSNWCEVVNDVAAQCSDSLRHLLIMDNSDFAKHFYVPDLKRYFGYIYRRVPIDQMLATMPELQTVYLPNVKMYNTILGRKAWSALENVPAEERLIKLDRIVLPTTDINCLVPPSTELNAYYTRTLPNLPQFAGVVEIFCKKDESASTVDMLRAAQYHVEKLSAYQEMLKKNALARNRRVVLRYEYDRYQSYYDYEEYNKFGKYFYVDQTSESSKAEMQNVENGRLAMETWRDVNNMAQVSRSFTMDAKANWQMSVANFDSLAEVLFENHTCLKLNVATMRIHPAYDIESFVKMLPLFRRRKCSPQIAQSFAVHLRIAKSLLDVLEELDREVDDDDQRFHDSTTDKDYVIPPIKVWQHIDYDFYNMPEDDVKAELLALVQNFITDAVDAAQSNKGVQQNDLRNLVYKHVVELNFIIRGLPLDAEARLLLSQRMLKRLMRGKKVSEKDGAVFWLAKTASTEEESSKVFYPFPALKRIKLTDKG